MGKKADYLEMVLSLKVPIIYNNNKALRQNVPSSFLY